MAGRRDRVVAVVTAGVLCAALLCLAWILTLAPGRRNDAVTTTGFVMTLTLAVITVLTALRSARRLPAPQTVDALADALASAVYGQWRRAADERSLSVPAPLSIRWTMSSDPVCGPVAAAVGRAGTTGRFSPVPGYDGTAAGDLRDGGARSELSKIFCGLASGRLIVIGEPGSGKTATAILLLLDTLGHRDAMSADRRVHVPVPLLFDAQGWNPIRVSVVDWLSRRMAETYPLFQHRAGRAEAVRLLTSHDRVALR